jgi:hypothetical protein
VIFVKALDMFSKLDIITLAGKLIGFAINVLPALVVVAIGMAFMMPFMIPATISSVLLIGLFTFLMAGFTILSIVNMDKANKQLKTL